MEALLLDVMRADNLQELARAIADGGSAALAVTGGGGGSIAAGSGRLTARALQAASAALELLQRQGSDGGDTAGDDSDDSSYEGRRLGGAPRRRATTAQLAALAAVDAVTRAPFHVSRVVGGAAVLHVGFNTRDGIHLAAVDVLERGVRCAVARLEAAAGAATVQQRVMAVLGEAEGRLVAAAAAAAKAAAADRLARAYAAWVDAGDDLMLACLDGVSGLMEGGGDGGGEDARRLHGWVAQLGAAVLAAADPAAPPPVRSLALHFAAGLPGLRGGISRLVQRVADEGKAITAVRAADHPDWDATDAATYAASCAQLPTATLGGGTTALPLPRGGIHAQATDAVVALPVGMASPPGGSGGPPQPVGVLVALGPAVLSPAQAEYLAAGARQIARKVGALLALARAREATDGTHGAHAAAAGELRAQLAAADDTIAALQSRLAHATASLGLYGAGGEGGDIDGVDEDAGFAVTTTGDARGEASRLPPYALLRPAMVVSATHATPHGAGGIRASPPLSVGGGRRGSGATAGVATPHAGSGVPVDVAFHTAIAVVDALRRAAATVATDVEGAGAGAAAAASRAIEHQLHSLAPCRVVATVHAPTTAHVDDDDGRDARGSGSGSGGSIASPSSAGVLRVATEAGVVFDLYFERAVAPACRAVLSHGLRLFGPLWHLLRSRSHAVEATAAAQAAQGAAAAAAAEEAAAAEDARASAADAARAAEEHARAAAAAEEESAGLRAALEAARATMSALEPTAAASRAATHDALERVAVASAGQARLHTAMQLVAELAAHVDGGADVLWLNTTLLRRVLSLTTCAALAVAHMPDPSTGAMSIVAAVTAEEASPRTGSLEATLAAAAGRMLSPSRSGGKPRN